jgi:predicted transcriptional regulator
MPGRKGQSKTCLIHVWTAPAVKDKLDELARTVGKSRSAVVRALIVHASVADLPRWWPALSAEEQQLAEEVEG